MPCQLQMVAQPATQHMTQHVTQPVTQLVTQLVIQLVTPEHSRASATKTKQLGIPTCALPAGETP